MQYGQLVSCPMNISQKIHGDFPVDKNQDMTVGWPSLAAKTGGHGGPPHLFF